MSNYKIDLPVSEKYSSDNNLINVDNNTNTKLFEEVYLFAEYFKKELDFGSIPFCKYGLTKQYKALLFTKEAFDKYIGKEPMPYRLYGACLFTPITIGKDIHWKLEWIWFHPFFRNRGNLKKNWDMLEEEFNDFFIGKPISPDMNNFLKKIDPETKHILIN